MEVVFVAELFARFGSNLNAVTLAVFCRSVPGAPVTVAMILKVTPEVVSSEGRRPVIVPLLLEQVAKMFSDVHETNVAPAGRTSVMTTSSVRLGPRLLMLTL